MSETRKPILLVAVSDRPVLAALERDYRPGNPIVAAMSLGRIDYHLVKPWTPATGLYPAVGEFLSAWAASREPESVMFRIVTREASARAHRIRELLTRMHVPHVCRPPDSDVGRRLLSEAGLDASRLPATCAAARSSGSPRPLGRGPSRSSSSTGHWRRAPRAAGA